MLVRSETCLTRKNDIAFGLKVILSELTRLMLQEWPKKLMCKGMAMLIRDRIARNTQVRELMVKRMTPAGRACTRFCVNAFSQK
ncbi:hypothetical protein APX81_07945 [Escherichia coli]|nr:hypothetical protein [Escherichia coli]EEW6031959.1 hypothetical protein [Escherichia coli]EFN9261288.1 hypothetical protein [Escherichia coli]PAZ22957.1 hypothetical protein APU33_25475 [Escherichia coli]PAZ28636.1 hypothetical protein APU34_22365 [Escherichia coli]